MKFIYGSYEHAENDIDVSSINIQRLYSPRNRLIFKRHTLALQGHLITTGQDNIKTAIEALEEAYSKDLVSPGQGDAGLYHDDGTASAHFLDRSESINGIRVLAFHYGTRDGSEYATGRQYSIVLQADFLADWEDAIYSFDEQVLHIGNCGHDWEYVEHFMTPPKAFINHVYTVERIIQRGEAVGLFGYPAKPNPVMPEQLHGNLNRVEYGSCRMIGRADWQHGGLMLWPISWQYTYSVPIHRTIFPFPDYPG